MLDDGDDIRLSAMHMLDDMKKSDITRFGFALRKEQDLEVIEAA